MGLVEPSEHGVPVTLLLSGLIFIASVGFFNIVSAVFLQSIMDYESAKKLQRQRERLRDKRLWKHNMSRLIDILLQLHDKVENNGLVEMLKHQNSLKSDKEDGCKWFSTLSHDSLLKVRFSRELVDFSAESVKEFSQILADLDIEPQDCLCLSDTLDRNNDGTIDVMEFISGLQRLRGPARRSDVIAVDLAVQSMQAKMDEIWMHHDDGHVAMDASENHADPPYSL